MSFLLDTNVISEWTKPRSDPDVLRWFAEVDEDRTFISIVTIAEVRRGIQRLADGARRTQLEQWLISDVPRRFDYRILNADAATADLWGRLMALSQARGRPVSVMDVWIAATARQHRLTLVTRNVADFEMLGIPIVNPWIT